MLFKSAVNNLQGTRAVKVLGHRTAGQLSYNTVIISKIAVHAHGAGAHYFCRTSVRAGDHGHDTRVRLMSERILSSNEVPAFRASNPNKSAALPVAFQFMKLTTPRTRVLYTRGSSCRIMDKGRHNTHSTASMRDHSSTVAVDIPGLVIQRQGQGQTTSESPYHQYQCQCHGIAGEAARARCHTSPTLALHNTIRTVHKSAAGKGPAQHSRARGVSLKKDARQWRT